MKCTCPKCRVDIELDLPVITEKGCPTACTACKARLYVHRESFGSRAYRVTGEISCAACGQPLGPDTYCYECGTPYPDYLVVAHGSKPATLKHSESRSATFVIPGGGTKPHKQNYIPANGAPAKSVRGIGLNKRHLLTAMLVLLLVVLMGGGVVAYKRNKAEQLYAENFVKLTYCIHSGQARSLQACTKIAADWKTKSEGQGPSPRIGVEEEKDYALLNSEMELLQAKMNEPPEKYQQCNAMLASLKAPAQKIQALALAPSPSLASLSEATTLLDAEYQKAVNEFKAAVPAEILQELQSASKRYKALQTMVK